MIWAELHTPDVESAAVALEGLGLSCARQDLADFGRAVLLSFPEPCGVIVESSSALEGWIPFRSVASVTAALKGCPTVLQPLQVPGGVRAIVEQVDGSLQGLWERGRTGTLQLRYDETQGWMLVLEPRPLSSEWVEPARDVFSHPGGLCICWAR